MQALSDWDTDQVQSSLKTVTPSGTAKTVTTHEVFLYVHWLSASANQGTGLGTVELVSASANMVRVQKCLPQVLHSHKFPTASPLCETSANGAAAMPLLPSLSA